MKINYGTHDLTGMRSFYNSDVRTAISHICSKDMFVIIIVASILAYTIPDVIPVAYADNTLYVSAESDMFENYFVGAQVIEVIVNDDQYTNRNMSFMPTVTVNNAPLLMVQAQSGNWYGYFVEMDKAKAASANGAIYYGEMTEIQYDFSTVLNLYLLEWPFDETYGHYALKEPAVGHLIFGEYYYSGTPLLAYSFTEGDDVEVKLHNGASTESVTLRYDTVEDYAGLLLDRGTYPQNAHVHIAITDTWLNIDPTSEDIWTMTTGDDPSLYYGVDNVGDVAVDTSNLMCDDNCALIIKDRQNQGDMLELSPNLDRYGLTDADMERFSIRFEEISPNSGVFTNSDDYGGTNVAITDTARRGTTATIDYNDSSINIAVGNSFALIDIQLQDDTWNNGEEIPVIIIDDDANRNGAWSEGMVVSDPKSIIPTLVIGSPITLDDNSVYGTGNDDYITTDTTTFSKRGMVSIDGDTLVLRYGGQPLSLLDYADDFKGFVYFNYHFESISDSVSVTLTTPDEIGAVMASDCITNNFDMTLDCLETAGVITSQQRGDILDFDEISYFVDNTCSITLVDNDNARGYVNVNESLAALYKCDINNDIVLVINGVLEGDDVPVVADFMSFGYRDDGVQSSERVANQIIRIEARETEGHSGIFEGTLEYIMLNQLNVLDRRTYDGVDPINDRPVFILPEGMTGDDAPTVTYLDLGADGVYTQISDSQDAPSHSGIVSFDSDNYKIADTVTVTLNDPDLNTDPELIDVYTVVHNTYSSVFGKVGADLGVKETFGDLGRLLDITFDDWDWPGVYDCGFNGDADGLQATGFSLVETGVATGIFTGDFQIPAEWCHDGWLEPTAGYDIQVNYVDFRDESGDIIEVGDSSTIGAHTGSISLDRTVYPVPFGMPGNFGHDQDHEADPENESFFPIHSTGFDGDGGLKYINAGDLTIHVRITDTDYNVSATGQDTISRAVEGTDNTGPVKVMVKRGPSYLVLGYAGGPEKTGDRAGFLKTDSDTVRQFGPIQEIAPDAGVFEIDIKLKYTDGPSSADCPNTAPDGYPDYLSDEGYFDNRFATSDHFCILQSDTLEVEYRDTFDASGNPNTVTDSAVFDLRNGVLQSDKSQYVIGTDMILTLIEPDLDLDNDHAETYDLDLIEWNSHTVTLTMGDSGGEYTAFDPVPMYFRETGDSTGIFQIIIRIPAELEGVRLDRDEDITLEYVDWGPAGANYVGDIGKSIRLGMSTTDFGATVISAVGETIVLNTEGSSVPGCEVTNDCFVPPVVTINMGEKIVWKNVDNAAHTVTSGVLADGGPDGVFDSGLFVPDTEFSHTFDAPGEYPYFCLVHPWMAGMIVVQEAVDGAPSGQPYVNIENNFFMEFPKEWSVQNMYGADQPTVAAVGSGIGVMPPSIAVYVEEAGSHTLNTVRESKLADLETLEGNLEILNHELTSINGFDAFVLDATYVFDPDTVLTDIKYREATIVSSGKIYTLLFSTALSDFDSYVHHFTESLESFGIIMRESDESPPQRTIRETDLRLEFYDSKDNHYVWTLPISAYEDAVFESRLKSTSLALNPLRLDMDDGETITTTRLDGFVRGSFGNVIDNVYDNSYDDADFIWEVWHVVSQLTVYDADVYLHSEGRFATETFSRGGGDCEDLAILIADMLASSEHTADWNIQYLYMDTDNPKDPQKVNHVMLHVDDGVRTYLIEATGEPSWNYYPDGVRGWFIDARD